MTARRTARTVAGRLVLALVSALTTLLATPAGATGEVGADHGRLILVLDSSGSMKEPAGGGVTRIRAAKEALGTVIDDLPAEAYVGLRVFGSEAFSRNDPGACEDTRLVVEPGTDNRDRLRQAVRSYTPYGETPIPAALEAAAEDIGSEGKRSIVLVSDGESTCGDPCSVAADIAGQGIDLRIDVVGLTVTGNARQQLQCIADKGNGTYYDASNAAELADSLTVIADRAVQPLTLQGSPVTGTTDPRTAPEVGEGTWLDELPAAQEVPVHYRVHRTVPGSTLWIGAAAQPHVAQQQLVVELATPGGENCGRSADMSTVGGGTEAVPVLVGALTKPDGECATTDELVLSVTHTDWSRPVPTGTPMQLTVIEEPPLTTQHGLLLAQQGKARWQPMTRRGEAAETTFGTGFANAPELTDGWYRSEIVPGEVQLFRVPLDWGQALQVEMSVPPNKALHDRFGSLAPPLRTLVFNPVGARVDSDFAETDDDPRTGGFVHPSHLEERVARHATREVRYLNREGSSGDPAALAGDYYVMVYWEFEGRGGGDSLLEPYEIGIMRTGTAGTGTPDYGEEPSAEPTDDTTAAPGPERPAFTEPAAGPTETDEAGGPGTVKLVAGTGIAGLGVIALLGAVLLLLKRRS